MKAELLFIGTELLLGEIENRNAVYLAGQLADLGIDVYYHTAVGDNLERIVGVLQQAHRRSDAVLMTGGLGPTMDDPTREALARFSGRPLRLDAELYRDLEAFYRQRGMPLREGSRRQAMLPEGAQALPNPWGTAPGIWLEHEGRLYIALPGPPREMRPMFEQHVRPRLLTRLAPEGQPRLYRRVLKVCGVPEASLEEQLKDLIAHQQDPTIAPYAKSGEVHLRLATKATSPDEAEQRFAPIESEIRRRLGWRCYGRDDDTLEAVVGARLQAQGLTLAIGESCTGGLAGARITAVPGSSAWFLLSVVAYANSAKEQLLGVPADVLQQHGAVSEPVALALAEGARRQAGADIGLGITGIAGPGGGSEQKPVGTVYLAITGPYGSHSRHVLMRGSRDDIRHRTVTYGLVMLLGYLERSQDTVS
ncbi:MAG TPA: competence/damage-inducible protein A [Bacillota bacterium]